MTELIETSDGNIADFYRGQSILVTGATGFVGKCLVEKLLRSCPDIDTLYLLMRSKKEESIHERADKLFSDVAFKRLGKAAIAKVIPIAGDITQPGLGLSVDSRKLLTERVSTVFHSAATVSFADTLRKTLITNLRGTSDIIQLCKEMERLSVLCYVSTAYSHCPRSDIDEIVYDIHISPDQMLKCIETMSNEQMEILAPKVIGKWPNYYAFSKALAENLVKNESINMPVAIYRPSIVVGAMNEPHPGWIDNVNGPSGMVVGGGMGVIRCFNGNLNMRMDLVPVDIVANGMIATAWDVATHNKKELKVFNGTSGARNPLQWREFTELLVEVGVSAPPSKCVWHYSFSVIQSVFWYRIAFFLLHTIPGALMDFASLLLGKKRRMMRLYRRIDTHMGLASYFALRQWNFTDKNMQGTLKKMSEHDKAEFPCDVEAFTWLEYMRNYYLGLRKFILKDDESTIPAAVIRYRKLYYLHRGTQLVMFSTFIWITSSLCQWALTFV